MRREIFVQKRFKRMVGNGVGATVDEDLFIRGLRHQGRTLGDLIHALLQRDGVRHQSGAHHIEHGRGRLYHVRREAAAVHDGVMDARVVLGVLAQVLHAHVHQFHGVERRSAELGIARRVRRSTFKFIKGLDAGVAGTRHHLVDVGGMPGESEVEAVEDALLRHKRLGGAALLAGRTVEDHGSLLTRRTKILLDAVGGGKCTRTEQMVAAAVPRRAPR